MLLLLRVRGLDGVTGTLATHVHLMAMKIVSVVLTQKVSLPQTDPGLQSSLVRLGITLARVSGALGALTQGS